MMAASISKARREVIYVKGDHLTLPQATTHAVAFLVTVLTVNVGHSGAPHPDEIYKELQSHGKWVLTSNGEPPPPGARRRGLQSSGLTHAGDKLVSIGDQRSENSGHVLFIDPTSARLLRDPLLPTIDAERLKNNPEVAKYRSIRNSDFEGVCRHPTEPEIFFAVTENKVPWIVEIHVPSMAQASFRQFAPLEFPAGLSPWRDDNNFRVEGITIADDAETLFLAFERARDNLPRILTVSVAAVRTGKPLNLVELPIRFDDLRRRNDKARARLNLNGLQFLRHKKRRYLVAIARDQERILLINLESNHVERVVDLVLLSPDGSRVKWVSPEGIAVDPKDGRLWLINDPDSVRNNYRAVGAESAKGMFALYTPLLFELPLSSLLSAD